MRFQQRKRRLVAPLETKRSRHDQARALVQADGDQDRRVWAELPLTLAKEIASYLVRFHVERVSEFEELVRSYPLSYLRVSLLDVTSNSRDESRAMAQFLRRIPNTMLDLKFYGRGQCLDVTLVSVMLRLRNIECLWVEHLSLPMANAFRLLPHLLSSKNKTHALHFVFDKDEGAEMLESHAAVFVSKLLKGDQALVNLDVSRSGIALPLDKLRRYDILGALVYNDKIRDLRLRDVKLDKEGAIRLSKVMATHNSIELIDLSENEIGDEGVEAFAVALQKNTKLMCVLLSMVSMTGQGGCALAQALRVNNTLERLYLKDDDLGPKCGQEFAAMLMVNKTLRRLYLDFSDIGPEGCRPFIQAIRVNRTLRQLRLNYNKIDVNDKACLINEALRGGVLEVLETADRNELDTPSVSRKSKTFKRSCLVTSALPTSSEQ